MFQRLLEIRAARRQNHLVSGRSCQFSRSLRVLYILNTDHFYIYKKTSHKLFYYIQNMVCTFSKIPILPYSHPLRGLPMTQSRRTSHAARCGGSSVLCVCVLQQFLQQLCSPSSTKYTCGAATKLSATNCRLIGLSSFFSRLAPTDIPRVRAILPPDVWGIAELKHR